MNHIGETKTFRDGLDFANAVRSAFAFVHMRGFSEVEVGPTIVRFESRSLQLTIYHGRSSHEIRVEIGLKGTSARGYSLSEVIRLADEAEGRKFRNPLFATREGVWQGVATVAVLLKKFGEALLNGDQDRFFQLDEQRKRWSETYARDVLAEQLRPSANEAFREGRYGEAANLFERIKARLSPVELQKLEVANRRRGARPLAGGQAESGVKRTFPELPAWTFDLDEVSVGVYKVYGVDEAGRSVQASGTDPDLLVDECRRSAIKIRDMAPRRI